MYRNTQKSNDSRVLSCTPDEVRRSMRPRSMVEGGVCDKTQEKHKLFLSRPCVPSTIHTPLACTAIQTDHSFNSGIQEKRKCRQACGWRTMPCSLPTERPHMTSLEKKKASRSSHTFSTFRHQKHTRDSSISRSSRRLITPPPPPNNHKVGIVQ